MDEHGAFIDDVLMISLIENADFPWQIAT